MRGRFLDILFEALAKGSRPPAGKGWQPIPRPKGGRRGYRRRKGRGWEYWYPDTATKDRLPGGHQWWRPFGFRNPPGWDGTWRDTTAEDPARYEKHGVKAAADHMLRLRELRVAGKMPAEIIDAVSLFALTSTRTAASTHERVWPKVEAWIQQPASERDPEDLRRIMRPLGFQNTRTEQYKKARGKFKAILKVMHKHPTDGRAAREALAKNKDTKVMGLAKISFMLELLGYSDVACIDARVITHLTQAPTEAAGRLASKLSTNAKLYDQFESALKRSAAYQATDPEPLRMGMAQWRMWDAEGGSDTTHGVFWKTVDRIITSSLSKSGRLPKHFNKSLVLAGAVKRSWDMGGAAPIVYDAVPVLVMSAQ